jgi:hypothetical protein
MSADCHISATVQSPVGDQREPVVRHDEAAWHLKEYLSHASVPIYMREQAWEQWKLENPVFFQVRALPGISARAPRKGS